MNTQEALDAIAKAMRDDAYATPDAVGVPALALVGEFFAQQKRTADALERIAAALEVPEAE